MSQKIPLYTVLSVAALAAPSALVFAQGSGTLPDVAARGNIAEVRRLLDAGVSVESRQAGTGWTPLITAANAGRTATAALLLERGANPNAAGFTGYTPLMAATQTRNIPLIRTLLLRNANPDKATAKGLTPLMLAAGGKGDARAQAADLECVKLLLRGGANPDKKHSSGATAYSLATARGAAPITAFLRRVGTGGNVPTEGASLSDGVLAGSVLYRERIAVSPDAFAMVRLLDVAPKNPVVVAQTLIPFAGKQVPVEFSLPYKGATLAARPGAQFALDARIVSGGAVRFRTAGPVPALTPDSSDKKVALTLRLVTEEVQSRLASEGIAATDKAIAQAGAGFSSRQRLGELATSYTASFLGGRLVRITATSTQSDYGTRNDRFYFSEGVDSEGFPVLRASYLNARRIARTPSTDDSGRSEIVPGKYENVVQKILLDDVGKQSVATKVVDGQNQGVSTLDITAARNLSRILATEALRVARQQRRR